MAFCPAVRLEQIVNILAAQHFLPHHAQILDWVPDTNSILPCNPPGVQCQFPAESHFCPIKFTFPIGSSRSAKAISTLVSYLTCLKYLSIVDPPTYTEFLKPI